MRARLAGPVPFPETMPLPKRTPDPDLPTQEKPPCTIPPHVLRAMVLTLADPAAEAALVAECGM